MVDFPLPCLMTRGYTPFWGYFSIPFPSMTGFGTFDGYVHLCHSSCVLILGNCFILFPLMWIVFRNVKVDGFTALHDDRSTRVPTSDGILQRA